MTVNDKLMLYINWIDGCTLKLIPAWDHILVAYKYVVQVIFKVLHNCYYKGSKVL